MRRLVISLAAVLLIGGCGFKPMYAQRGDAPAVSQELATIKIDPIPDRLGQLVRNALLERINPTGEPASPVYRLQVKVAEEREDVGIRRDASTTRSNFRLSAEFTLIEEKTNTVLLNGTTWSQTAFDVVQQDFATIAAQQDAQRRLAQQIADELTARMAGYFDRDK